MVERFCLGLFVFWFSLAVCYLALSIKSCRWYRKVKGLGGVIIDEEGGIKGGIKRGKKEELEREGYKGVDIAEFFRSSSLIDMVGFILASFGAILAGLHFVL